jgi:peroxiredoxin family protein/TusA-related sulfurtransferase/rhodanese-related sulfurtransferase
LTIVDVRTPDEFMAGTIPGALNIPLQELRQRMDELSRDKKIVIFCRVGLRGYLAARILTQKGYNAENLAGGYLTYQLFHNPGEAIYDTSELTDDTGFALDKEDDHEFDIAHIENRVDLALDARGLQCPGPVMKMKKAVEELKPGQILQIKVSDSGFKNDAPAWCKSTGNKLVHIEEKGKEIIAYIQKNLPRCTGLINSAPRERAMTNVIFSNDLDKAIAALIIANGASAAGYKVTLFFTFWGLSILRKSKKTDVKKGIMDKMFGWMLPRGVNKLSLSKMHMLGMGTGMMKMVMKDKNVSSLEELLNQAIENNVKIAACKMSMDVMGIKEEELIEGVEISGVAHYIDELTRSGAGMFIG